MEITKTVTMRNMCPFFAIYYQQPKLLLLQLQELQGWIDRITRCSGSSLLVKANNSQAPF